MESAGVKRVWRPRLWVRCVAVGVPLLLASTLLYPQVLNPEWASGTPRNEMVWLVVIIAITSVAVGARSCRVWKSTTQPFGLSTPWGSRVVRRDRVKTVAAGSYGVEFITMDGDRLIALAVQATAAYMGDRPRWVDLAIAVTGREPKWRDEADPN